MLPWMELVTGVALLTGVMSAGALCAAFLLLAVFTVAQSTAIGRGLLIPCGCSSLPSKQVIGLWDVIGTASLALLAGAGMVASWATMHRRTPSPLPCAAELSGDIA